MLIDGSFRPTPDFAPLPNRQVQPRTSGAYGCPISLQVLGWMGKSVGWLYKHRPSIL